MKIAFDYDGTISEDLEGWLAVMYMMKDRGHDCFVVTFRDNEHDWNEDLRLIEEANFPIYWTKGVAKRWWCGHFGPGLVDVWIDDKPEAIINNSYMLPSELVEWREDCKLAKSA
jgi:hypothetical protein